VELARLVVCGLKLDLGDIYMLWDDDGFRGHGLKVTRTCSADRSGGTCKLFGLLRIHICCGQFLSLG
jgi:hypothetical protein